jgi:diguanylate cyclase (GGDEF)-like protein
MKSLSDMARRPERAKRPRQVAQFDKSTGLANRALLVDRLNKAIAQSKRWGQLVAVVRLDLDGLEVINDCHGYDAGGQVLRFLARGMKRSLAKNEVLARLEGNKFAAVLPALDEEQQCMPALIRLLEAAAEPAQVGDSALQLSASLGVAFYPQDEDTDADQLLRQASQAMHRAKAAGKNLYRFFDSALDGGTGGNPESLERIRLALAAREFLLVYQPKVNMCTGEVAGVEALIRWQHPERGFLQPEEFLPVIEDHPFAVVLGEWVIDAALAQMEEWLDDGLDISVSMNIGARQLRQSGFSDRLVSLLADHPRIKPSSLELEIREVDPLEDMAQLSSVLAKCRNTGVSFALDNFGSSHLALVDFKHLPVDVLKIDPNFVRAILENPDDLTILEGVLGLATAFRRQPVAKGVETMEQGLILLRLGCKLAQGYGIARPMPADQLPGWIAAWRPDPRWNEVLSVAVDQRPLLHAGVEHRAWAADLEAFLKGESSIEPRLSRYQCRFGAWLYAEGPDGRSSQPAFQPIIALHWKIHAMAAGLVKHRAHGRNDEALARLDELKNLVDKLADQLNAFHAKA